MSTVVFPIFMRLILSDSGSGVVVVLCGLIAERQGDCQYIELVVVILIVLILLSQRSTSCED